MGSKFSVRRAYRIACASFYQWVMNPRMIVAASMIVFIWNFAVSPLVSISREMNTPLNIVEPYIAVLNSRTLCLVMPSVYVFLVSDCPRLDKSSQFTLHRVSKTEWVTGQFLFFVLTAFAFSVLIFLSAILPNCLHAFAANGWSTVATKYAVYYPEKSASFSAQLIKGELYHQIAPYHAALLSFTLSLLYEILLGMMLLLFQIWNLRKYGIATAIGIIGLGTAFGLFRTKCMWYFPMAHTMVELHYTKYLKEPVMDMRYSFVYFAVIIALVLTVCMITIKQTDFIDYQE